MGQETPSTRPELLHVGIFAVFTKADVTFIGGGSGCHNRRRLVGKSHPVGLRGRQGHRGHRMLWSSLHALLPLIPSPGGWVLLGVTAAGGEDTDTAQDGEQRGAPAQVEGRAQFIPGGVEEVSASPARGAWVEAHHPPGQVPYLVPAYRGLKKSVVMLTAYHEIATIPQAPGEKVRGSRPKCPLIATNPSHAPQARAMRGSGDRQRQSRVEHHVQK